MKFIIDWTTLFINLFGIYLLWISIFYFSSHLHVYLCTPYGIYGFLLSPFLYQTPQCVAIRWLQINGTLYINAFWTLLAGMAIRKLTFHTYISNEQPQSSINSSKSSE